mmetsp:Transcript_21490/g.27094  ORF Transcript_21490/g.27094 Transcript_21490/m.27094 type:complete len:252 (-) Transcript_21490:93-848(-)
MMNSKASEIAALLKTEKYNPEIIPQLESYLESQVQQNVDTTDSPASPYDSNANRTLVKLYQFFPQNAQAQYIVLAAALALVYGTATKEGSLDFGSLGCLINESMKKEEPYPTLIRCADLLDSCQFSEFWSVFHSIENNSGDYEMVSKLSKSFHAKSALRKSILNTLSLSFKSTKLSYVLGQLDFEKDNESEVLLKGESDVVEQFNDASDSIIFTDNIENTKRNKVNLEGGIDYGMIRGLVMSNQVKRATAE